MSSSLNERWSQKMMSRMITRLHGSPSNSTDIQHIHIPRVLFVRETVAVTQLRDCQGRALAAIWSTLQTQGEASSEHAYVRYHSVDETEMDVEVGLPVDDTIIGDDTVSVGSLHKGPALTHLHFGSHQRLGGAYAALAEGDSAGLVPVGAPWETYQWFKLDSTPNPTDWPAQETWRTMLVQPLAPDNQSHG
ncbi:hypothetical protein [Micromonospora craniellae]|uniref:hypothetical protein n=1 Tax=Micromonospora craniellae TaxID=2294034 RepID=UPI0011C11656|nr:hypothetical protein [Micromonospora craniellae]QOC91575.1 hypothetical protein ID554_27120 [Micromonospora craniellae]